MSRFRRRVLLAVPRNRFRKNEKSVDILLKKLYSDSIERKKVYVPLENRRKKLVHNENPIILKHRSVQIPADAGCVANRNCGEPMYYLEYLNFNYMH